MITSNEIRQKFLDFFVSKGHTIVPSAPMVIKNDPTLMFTNAGMNQFKDIFLGNSKAKDARVANTQKCLRVSGKHNDLEEVGVDTYHHTMFEMLGNWSFGDYFKKEAIEWAWELLTEVYGLDKERLYITVFGGDEEDSLPEDTEAKNFWKSHINEDRILPFSKKDNFWEMGSTGPCGPCSEIHIDIRSDEERKKVDGRTLVNQDHPQVIEIWNLVFIQFNRMANGKLVNLPQQHVDTGMGLERLCVALQGKSSNYDTDVFQPMITKLAEMSGTQYGKDEKTDIALRVVSDHVRAIAFAIADGQLPSNNKAGYVIRRILRRAVRYGYSFLNLSDPFIHSLVPVLVEKLGGHFPEIKAQEDLIGKVIKEEEESFLRTLETGIKRFNDYLDQNDYKTIDGRFAFELYDTFGFPIDLTGLLTREKGLEVDLPAFETALQEQKQRSKADAAIDKDDWIVLTLDDKEEFIGYDYLSAEVNITRYRKINTKGKDFYQLVFNVTPFYAESGGQVGDTGVLESGEDTIYIIDTKKENDLIIHMTEKLPENLQQTFTAKVNINKRNSTANNHSATHLLHAALREVLGTHVEQKGSLVNAEHLRFDFSHFAKVTGEELAKIEKTVNTKIRKNIQLEENRNVPYNKALEMGAIALFGEKYGDIVRVIVFDPEFSVELCGGTHVKATGQIGFLKITSESSIAAGIRRIEAITGEKAEDYVNEKVNALAEVGELIKNPKNPLKGVKQVLDENAKLSKQIENLQALQVGIAKRELADKIEEQNGIKFLSAKVDLNPEQVKNLCFQLKGELDNLFLVLGSSTDNKPNIQLCISDNLVNDKGLNAGKIIRELAKEIKGGGGGQAFYASAGGSDSSGLSRALDKAKDFIPD